MSIFSKTDQEEEEEKEERQKRYQNETHIRIKLFSKSESISNSSLFR